MFLRKFRRTKDGKRHTYFALVESRRTERGPRQRVVAQLGELTDDQERRWQRTAVFHTRHEEGAELPLFLEDHSREPIGDPDPSAGGIYFGAYADPPLIIREGDPADYFPGGSVLYQVGGVWGALAMNDAGDFAALTPVQSAADGIADVLWLWRGLTGHYVPLLQTGADLFGRTLTLEDPLGDYAAETGGADGLPQSFNDMRQLATLLDFTDGTSGVYRIGPPLLGDTDGDGQVGPPELAEFAGCAAGAALGGPSGCEALDLNLDGSVDVVDVALLQAMVGEAR